MEFSVFFSANWWREGKFSNTRELKPAHWILRFYSIFSTNTRAAKSIFLSWNWMKAQFSRLHETDSLLLLRGFRVLCSLQNFYLFNFFFFLSALDSFRSFQVFSLPINQVFSRDHKFSFWTASSTTAEHWMNRTERISRIFFLAFVFVVPERIRWWLLMGLRWFA